jgi:hypothetical protein
MSDEFLLADEEEVEHPSPSTEYQKKKLKQFQGRIDSGFTANLSRLFDEDN